MVMQMHDLAVGAGWVSSPEFWRMKAGQFWWLYRAKTPRAVRDRNTDMLEIRRMVKEAKREEDAQWQK